jgi:hypothetical protein
MRDPVLNSISSQWGGILDVVPFNAIVRPEKNAQASFRKDFMCRLKRDMITQDFST